MDAKIDTLWARYNKNDQSECFHFLKLGFFHRVEGAYTEKKKLTKCAESHRRFVCIRVAEGRP